MTEEYQEFLPLPEDKSSAAERPFLWEKEAEPVRWGGFLRRTIALFVDLLVLACFSMLLFYLIYVGYKVGLAAHHRTLSLAKLEDLVGIAATSWLFLLIAYFVLLHGMDGRTVGKWLLGLRVVGVHHGPITYRQSFIRCLGALLSALSGVGWLWILWHREKRGWHDLLAGTRVVREPFLISRKY